MTSGIGWNIILTFLGENLLVILLSLYVTAKYLFIPISFYLYVPFIFHAIICHSICGLQQILHYYVTLQSIQHNNTHSIKIIHKFVRADCCLNKRSHSKPS